MVVTGFGANLPAVRSGGWHALPAYGAIGTVTPVLNRAYALPLWTGRAATITSLAAEVTLLGIGNLRAGLYRDAESKPGALVTDYGTVSTGLAGVKTWTVSTSIRPVLYWLVIAQQGLITVGLRSRATGDPIVSETSATLNVNGSSYYTDSISGALPSTFPAIAGTAQAPSLLVQLT